MKEIVMCNDSGVKAYFIGYCGTATFTHLLLADVATGKLIETNNFAEWRVEL